MRQGALALNMIVGPNEAQELERCLESYHARETFDEIVIVRTSDDPAVEAVIRKYTDKTCLVPWSCPRYPFGNFAGARNAALDMTTSDWVWWLDADDVCVEEQQEKLPKIRDSVLDRTDSEAEVFLMEYVIRERLRGSASVSFWRPRIFRRLPKLRWRNAVHENFAPPQWFPAERIGYIGGFVNTHRPTKMQYQSALRNVAILENEYKHYREEMDDDLVYFFGRDLMMAGRPMEGVSVLNELIYKMQLPAQLAGAAAVDIMLYFAYGKQHSSPKADEIPPERTPQAEKWARIAVAFDPERAEAIMVLGDVYLQRKEFSAAEKMYRAALARGMLKQTEDRCLKAHLHPYYNELPNQRLSELCLRRGEFVPALLHCTLAADANPGDAELLNRRGEILQQIFLDQKERIDVFCTD